MRERKQLACKMTPSVSGTEQHCYGGKGLRARRNSLNPESTIFFRNFLSIPGTFGDYCTPSSHKETTLKRIFTYSQTPSLPLSASVHIVASPLIPLRRGRLIWIPSFRRIY